MGDLLRREQGSSSHHRLCLWSWKASHSCLLTSFIAVRKHITLGFAVFLWDTLLRAIKILKLAVASNVLVWSLAQGCRVRVCSQHEAASSRWRENLPFHSCQVLIVPHRLAYRSTHLHDRSALCLCSLRIFLHFFFLFNYSCFPLSSLLVLVNHVLP